MRKIIFWNPDRGVPCRSFCPSMVGVALIFLHADLEKDLVTALGFVTPERRLSITRARVSSLIEGALSMSLIASDTEGRLNKDQANNFSPLQIELEIISEIDELNDNTGESRKFIYKKYESLYSYKINEIKEIISNVEKSYAPMGKLNLFAALACISIFSSIVQFISKPVEDFIDIGLVYCFIGSVFALICTSAMQISQYKPYRRDLRWGRFIGFIALAVGIVSVIAARIEIIPKKSSVASIQTIYQLFSSINYNHNYLANFNNIEASDNYLPIFVKYSNKIDIYFDKVMKVDKISAINLEDVYCTLYAYSINNGVPIHTWLSSSVIPYDKIKFGDFRVTAVQFKSIKRVEITTHMQELLSDFGILLMSNSGQFHYRFTNNNGFGRFEEFEIEILDNKGNKMIKKLYISFVGPDNVGTESRDQFYIRPVPSYIYGKGNDDKLYGNIKDDVIDGGDGNDLIIGYDGNDRLIGGLGNDTISGGQGEDEVEGGEGDDFIQGDDGNDKYLSGGNGKDTIYGGAGDDKIYGDNGNDALIGGEGNNIISGGRGADVFWMIKIGNSVDYITDFSMQENDKIEISNIVPDADQSSVNKFISAKSTSEGLMLLMRAKETDDYTPVALLANFKGTLTNLINGNAFIFSRNEEN